MAQVFSPNLAQNFPFRVQIGLTYPRSTWGPLSGATDLARAQIWRKTSSSVSRPYLPSLALWPTFRGHRPRLHTSIIAASDQSSAKFPPIWRGSSPSVARLAFPT